MTKPVSEAVELDETDLDMIRRGDMLGPRLGAKVFAILTAFAAREDELRRELKKARSSIMSNDTATDAVAAAIRSRSKETTPRALLQREKQP